MSKDDDEEEDVIFSPSVQHLSQHYKINAPPPECMIQRMGEKRAFNFNHIRQHIDFSRHFDGNRTIESIEHLLIPPSVTTAGRHIYIVAIGLVHWCLSGKTALGVNITDIPATITMGSTPFLCTLLPECSQIRAYDILFQTRPKTLTDRWFPYFKESDATVGIKINRDDLGETYFLPIGMDAEKKRAVCPLGYFRHKLLEENKEKPKLTVDTVRGTRMEGFLLEKEEYCDLLVDFKNCVADSRIQVDAKTFKVGVVPKYPKEDFRASIVLDLYYSS